ncbi:MAG: hypothetical protein PUD72_03000 [Oscillospiraceae bacterium]|nr:hypothetical protein [Oscillospiraceae bacterium]
MNTKMFTRVIAIVLAVIMLGSVVMVAVNSFAIGPEMIQIVNTGDDNTRNIIIVVAAVAFVVLIALVVIPALLKKRK